MTLEEYNRISLTYQILINSFDNYDSSQKKGFYKCFDKNNKIVSDEHWIVLKHFENLNLKNIYNNDLINTEYKNEKYLDSNLIVIEKNKVCLHQELKHILFYFLVYKLQDGLKPFIKLLNSSKNEMIKLNIKSEETGILKMNDFQFKKFVEKSEEIEKFGFTSNFLTETNSNYINKFDDNEFHINIFKIEKLIQNLETFDFKNLEIKF